MNASVLLFFLYNVLATAILGGKFASRQDKVVKNFGFALILDAIAFAIWSIAVASKPDNLETYVNVGVIFFIASLIFFLRSGTQRMSAVSRRTLIVFGVIIAAVLFYLRASVFPSSPSFSAEGLFFFNPHPIIQMIYIFGLAFTVLPAIDAVASKLSPGFAGIMRYGFIAEVVGGIILITSTNVGAANVAALHITGWIIGLVYLLLWTTFLFNKKALRNTN